MAKNKAVEAIHKHHHHATVQLPYSKDKNKAARQHRRIPLGQGRGMGHLWIRIEHRYTRDRRFLEAGLRVARQFIANLEEKAELSQTVRLLLERGMFFDGSSDRAFSTESPRHQGCAPSLNPWQVGIAGRTGWKSVLRAKLVRQHIRIRPFSGFRMAVHKRHAP